MNMPGNSTPLTRFAWLSIAAAILTMGLKATAYWLTGSVGLLSDAMESGVNLIGGTMALAMLMVAVRPPDDDHAFGHSKAEYFSSGVEGTLILVAAISIGVAAGERLHSPKPLEKIGLGLCVSVAASLVNLAVALLLLRTARTHNSITLEANAKHLLTDVWTSGGVMVGVGAVALTGWQLLDPIVALGVAANIIWTGIGIVRRSVAGLMDKALPAEEQEAVRQVLERYEADGIQCHDMRTRQAGAQRFVSLLVRVPGTWTVKRGHALLERLEQDIGQALPNTILSTHLEPEGDPVSGTEAKSRHVPPPAPSSGEKR
jgi:cation diffusion facilitator family transporter